MLLAVHRVLIGSAMGLGVLTCAWACVRYAHRAEGSTLAVAIGSALATVALALYWRKIPRHLGRP